MDSKPFLPFTSEEESIGEKPTPAQTLSCEVGKAPTWSPESLLLQEAGAEVVWAALVASADLLQQSQLLQSLPSMFIRDTFWGDLDTDTEGSRQLVTALSLVGQMLGALLLLQVSQFAHLDTCKVLPCAQGGRAGPGIPQNTG